MPRIHLDNAATSWPKPEAVYDAVDRYQRESGVAVGRGATRRGAELQSVVDRGRRRAAELLGAANPSRIVLTFNGTDSLNLAIHGLLRPGDHVVTSVVEHNSVLRPLRELEHRLGIEVTRVRSDETGRVDAADVREAVRPNTRLVVLLHASNVTGAIQPIADVGEIAREAGALFLVDAAQTAGHLPIDVGSLPVDLLACSGHKGLLGPLGTGLLYVRPGVEEDLASLRQGGTGSRSEEDRQPDTLPDRYESGNHNAPGLVGFDAALGWLLERGVESVREHESQLSQRLIEGLRAIDGVTVFGPADTSQRVGVTSIRVDGFDPRDLAAILDENFGIETRAGFHCAPLIHGVLGTAESGGTLRFGSGPFTTEDEIDAAVAAVRDVVSLG